MFKIIPYDQSKKDLWNNFVYKSKNATFLFDRNYMDYHSDRFKDFSLMIYDDKDLMALFPANIKDDTIYSHQGLTYGGMLYDENMKSTKMLEIFTLLKNFLQENQIKKLIYKTIPHIFHKMPAEEDLYALFRMNAKLFRRDLSSTIDQANKIKFERGRVRCIKEAGSNSLVIKKTQDFDRMHEIMEELLRTKYSTKTVHSAQEMKLLHDRFPNKIHLYGCYLADKMLSGAFIYETETVAHAQYVYSCDEGKNLYANDLMYDFLINCEFKHKKYFNFGVSTEKDGSYLNENLVKQKEMFGARAICHDFYELELQ